MPARILPVRLIFLTPGMLKPSPVAERAQGIWTQPLQAAACSGVSGASEAPKSTVRAVIWAMPVPEPTAAVFDRDAFFDFEAADPVGHQRCDQGGAGAGDPAAEAVAVDTAAMTSNRSGSSDEEC